MDWLKSAIRKVWESFATLLSARTRAWVVLIALLPICLLGGLILHLNPRSHPDSLESGERFLRLAWLAVGQRDRLLVPETKSVLQSIEDRIAARLTRASEGVGSNTSINGWTASQLLVSLGHHTPQVARNELVSRVDQFQDSETGGWREFLEPGAKLHVVVSAWALRSLRTTQAFDPNSGLRYLLNSEIGDSGSWPVKSPPASIQAKGSTYATSMVILTLLEWENDSRAQAIRPQLVSAIDRGIAWIANNRGNSGDWADYPELEIESTNSLGATSIATIVLLKAQGRAGTLPARKLASAAVRKLPNNLLRPWDREVSGTWFVNDRGEAIQDSMRVYPGPLILQNLVESYCHLNWKERFRALDYLDWYISRIEDPASALAREDDYYWISAEFLLGLQAVSNWSGCE